MAPLSLYATTRLTRLLQRVKDRLKPAKDRASIKPLVRRITSEEIEPHMHETIDRSPCRQTFEMDTRSGVQSRGTANPTHVKQYAPDDLPARGNTANINLQRLLQELDVYAAKDVSLLTAATNDKLFVQADIYGAPDGTSITGLRRIIDICDALLVSISKLSYEHPAPTLDHSEDDAGKNRYFSPDFTCEKFLANLEHILLWQRQSALDAIVHHYLNIVEGSLLYFYQQWLYRKSSIHDWFAEWPNGQRPLNTTWPWNVRPSLIVLWGVCWMFYDHNQNDNALPLYNKSDTFGQDIWMRQPTTSSEVEAQAQLAYAAASQPQNVQAVAASIEQVGSSAPYHTNYAWLQPYQQAAAAEPRRASISIPVTPSPAIVTSESTPSYIGVTSSGPSNVFPAPNFGSAWPFSQANTAQHPTTFPPDTSYWQTSLDPTPASVTNPFASAAHSPAVHPYAQHQVRSLSAGPPPTATSHLGFGLNIQTKNMQDYPSPQLSDVSVPAEPAYATPPQPIMEGGQTIFRTSNLSSPASLMSNEGFRGEPLRNAIGEYVCTEPACPDGNPAFARKCEYQKHIDKHLRPHICEQPGCENLRGFTYAGGLLRHQREVHRLNGGPRARCFCPHKACKRSSGNGFSRKENLAEHLRRVHRDTGSKLKENTETALEPLGGSGTRKRRRRLADEDEDEDEGIEPVNQSPSQSPQDLRQEVKKLRRELKEKDERLRRLEEQVQRLIGLPQ